MTHEKRVTPVASFGFTHRQAGFLVDEVADIVTIDGTQVQPAPDVEQAEPGVIQGLIQVALRGDQGSDAGTMVSLLDLEALHLTDQVDLAA